MNGEEIIIAKAGKPVARLALHRILALPIQLSHALRVSELPDLHRDPFDRLLVCKARWRACRS
jgi:PIN domain nuclease of toxin-antitoxin system